MSLLLNFALFSRLVNVITSEATDKSLASLFAAVLSCLSSMTIKGINFAAIFIEHKEENIIKISFRSQGNFDVNQFAREHFNGGGHINAAGGKSHESMKATTNKFEDLISKIII